MPKCPLHSFQRNNYFYGKLLTVRDFQTEQSYFNDKRYLNNRFVHGAGVLCGLHVEKDGDRGIMLKAGAALDCCGREIVVSEDFKKKIKDVTDFPEEIPEDTTLYLCLQYDECAREQVPVIDNPSSCQEVCEANRILEGFKLFIKEDVPLEAGICSLLYKTKVIYEDDYVTIERITPRWVRPNEVFTVKLVATKKPDNLNGNLYTITEILPPELTLIQGSEDMEFDLSSSDQVENSYVVKAGGNPGDIEIGGKINNSPIPQEENSTISIGEEPKIQKLINEYFSKESDTCPDCSQSSNETSESIWGYQSSPNNSNGDEPYIVIAAITVDSNFNIIDIVNAGVRPVVYNNPLLYKLITCHAVLHQHGGTDEINVQDLSGLLADPQKVTVQKEGGDDATRTKINFIGDGVSVADYPANEQVNVIIGVAPHHTTHESDGNDKINVNKLSGLLWDAQKVTVQEEDEDVATWTKINFKGEGVDVAEDLDEKRVNVTIPGVSTGSYTFEDVGAGDSKTSDLISHRDMLSLKPAIVVALDTEVELPEETGDKPVYEQALIFGDSSILFDEESEISPPKLAAFYLPDIPVDGFYIKLKDTRDPDPAGEEKDWTVRWWVTPQKKEV